MRKRTHASAESPFQTVSDAASALNLGTATVRRLAAEAGAIVKIGNSVRCDLPKLVSYIRERYNE